MSCLFTASIVLYFMSVVFLWMKLLPTEFTQKQGFNGWIGENFLFSIFIFVWPICLIVIVVLTLAKRMKPL